MKSTQAMRDRLRELSKPDQDDYDRAVICVLDDLEILLRRKISSETLRTACEKILKGGPSPVGHSERGA